MILRTLLIFAVIAATAGLTPGRVHAAAPTSTPSYQRHVSPLFSKLGCNGGTCHGAVKGQNGFRLSLFSADPDGDHDRLLREFGGRRLNLADPAASLLLRKATGQAEHGGGVRLRADSAEYDLLKNWIASGALIDAAGPSRIKELRVTPAEKVAGIGQQYQLRVEARFANDTTEDVTPFCSFESLDRAAATVDHSGRVSPLAVGEAVLIIRYRAQPAMARIIVPHTVQGAFPEVKAVNFIDSHIHNKLRQLNLPPAAVADDATFLRRACLDVCGELPTPEEVRAFLSDPSADKRSKKIEELLKRPGHAALWTLKFCDILKAADYGVYADALTLEADAPRFQEWVRARLAENIPYDEFVERIILATSREGHSAEDYAQEVLAMMEGYSPGRKDLALYAQRRTLDLFWQRRGADGVGGAMQVAHAFLGLRLECAQCHRHPHDVWRQEDLLEFANFFMQVRKVGFEGDNEKRYPEMAALKKRFDDEAKALETAIKAQKEGEGKKLDDEAKKAKTESEKLNAEIARLVKDKASAEEIDKKRKELELARATLARAESFRLELSEKEKRAKLLPEVGRRLLQAEIRLLPPGTSAKVTSPLGTREAKSFRLLGEADTVNISAGRDPRALVVDWMRKPGNPYFARAIVNRVWAHYFGRGIVDPPDNLSIFNAATHPALLKELSEGFVKNKYDLRWLHRTILNSRTYQQTSMPSAGASMDRSNYACAPIRRLPAEVLLDAVNFATGTTEKMDMKFHHWPDELKTIEVPFVPRNAFVAFVLETYGRPRRNSAVQCDCERDGNASVFQVLTLRKILEFARKYNAPIMSSSLFRHEQGMEAALRYRDSGTFGPIRYVICGVEGCYSPDGWIVYGQHPAWTAVTLLGPGAEAVSMYTRESQSHAIVTYPDRMPAELWFGRPSERPEYCHTEVYFQKKRFEYTPSIEGDFWYRHHYEMFRMAATFRGMVKTRKEPVPHDEIVAVTAIVFAAAKSVKEKSRLVALEEVNG